MKRFIVSSAIVLTASLMLFACASISKIAKSGNPELIYETALKQYKAEKWSRASNLFDACQGYYIGSAREDSIAFFSARSKYKHRDYAEAGMCFDEFRHKFGRSIFIEDAEAMYAMCQYFLAPGPTRDQALTAKAIIAFTEFIERFPDSRRVKPFKSLIEELTLRLHERNFINAYTYYKIHKYKSAIVAFKNALKNYGDTIYRERILYYIVASHYQFAHNSITDKQYDRYMNLLDAYYSFIAEYPESEYRKEVDKYAEEAKDHIDKNKLKK